MGDKMKKRLRVFFPEQFANATEVLAVYEDPKLIVAGSRYIFKRMSLALSYVKNLLERDKGDEYTDIAFFRGMSDKNPEVFTKEAYLDSLKKRKEV